MIARSKRLFLPKAVFLRRRKVSVASTRCSSSEMLLCGVKSEFSRVYSLCGREQ